MDEFRKRMVEEPWTLSGHVQLLSHYAVGLL